MKRFSMLALGLMAASTVSAQVVFEEDFEQFKSSVGTGDRSALEAAGWEFVNQGDVFVNPLTAVTVEFNIEMSEGGLHPNIGSSQRLGRTIPNERGMTDPSGVFVISDADAHGGSWVSPLDGVEYPSGEQNHLIGTGQSHDIYTPRIDCSSLSTVFFKMDTAVNLNNNGTAIFAVDARVGDGPWVNGFIRVAPSRFVGETFRDIPVTENFTTADYDFPTEGMVGKDGNQGGTYGPIYVDFSEITAGQSDVQFRVRHAENDWDWWVAFDNVVVSSDGPPTGGETIFGPEEFEEGLPSDWTINQSINDVDNAWTDRENNLVEIDAFDFHYGIGLDSRFLDGDGLNRLAGQGYAIYQSIPDLSIPIAEDGFVDPLAVGTLDTPVIDCSGFEEVFFYCWSEFNPGGAGIEFYIEFSVDGGTTFETLFDFNLGLNETGEGSRAQEHFIPVPEAAGQSAVVFRFTGIGADGNRFFAIDDVTVTGNQTATNVPAWELY